MNKQESDRLLSMAGFIGMVAVGWVGYVVAIDGWMHGVFELLKFILVYGAGYSLGVIKATEKIRNQVGGLIKSTSASMGVRVAARLIRDLVRNKEQAEAAAVDAEKIVDEEVQAQLTALARLI